MSAENPRRTSTAFTALRGSVSSESLLEAQASSCTANCSNELTQPDILPASLSLMSHCERNR